MQVAKTDLIFAERNRGDVCTSDVRMRLDVYDNRRRCFCVSVIVSPICASLNVNWRWLFVIYYACDSNTEKKTYIMNIQHGTPATDNAEIFHLW